MRVERDDPCAGIRVLLEAGGRLRVVGVAAPARKRWCWPAGADERVLAGLRAGAAGLLLKDSEPPELVRAVQLLARGEALLAPSLVRRLIAELASRPVPDGPDPELVDELTAREREVVALVGLGLDSVEIAERLVVSPATAKTHVSHAMLKVGATDRAKVVVFAYEAGLVAPGVASRAHSAVGTPSSAAAVTVTSAGSGCADIASRSSRRCSLTSLSTGKADCRRIASSVGC